MITLENFEHEIDSKILQRGREYYRDGQVGDIDYTDGVWTVAVYGSDYYEVQIEQQPHGQLLTYCDCPYDLSPYCKHVAAVLYALQAQSREAQKPKKTSKSSGQTVREVIETLSRENLQMILLDVVKKDKNLANSILLGYSNDAPQKETYVKTIQDALKSVPKRGGFIEYRDMRRAAAPINALLGQAEQYVKDGQIQKAFPILQAIVETMTPALQFGDDSDGEFGGLIEGAFNLFDDAVKLLKPDEKPAWFNYFLQQSQLDAYAGSDYDWGFLQLAADLIETPQERTHLFEAIHRKIASAKGGFYSVYQREMAVEIRLGLMERLGDTPEDIHAFLIDNINLNGVRQRLIAQYIAEGKLNTARKWTLEGLKDSQAQNLIGLVHQYQNFLMQIAQSEDDPLAVMDIARDMFFNTHQFEYYDTLKKAVSPEKWPEYLSKLIMKVGTQPTWGRSDDLLAAIYEREEMWPELMALAKKRGVGILDQYKESLHLRYAADASALYEEAVYKLLTHASGRGAYEQAAEYLSRMRQLGQAKRVQEIIDDLKAKYPRRSAMNEELNKINKG